MEISVHLFPSIKLGLHIAHAVLTLLVWVLCIVVFRSGAIVDGRLGWTFGLCFLTVPAIIYQTMTPRFPRTRRFANPYAIAIVDVLFTILWLSAFAAVAAWNRTGQCTSGCKVSRVIVAFGVIIWLIWCVATFLSVYGCIYFRREGYLPGASRAPNNASMIDPDKEAFSTAPHDEYAPVHDADEHEIQDVGMGYGRTQPPSYSGGSGSYVSPHVNEEPTAYEGYSAHGGSASGSTSGRAKFPDGRYDNVTVFDDR